MAVRVFVSGKMPHYAAFGITNSGGVLWQLRLNDGKVFPNDLAVGML